MKNILSMLTGATGDRILDEELLRAFLSRCMVEAASIGERIGLPISADLQDRHAVTRKLGAFKTSMLQDLEASKPVELDALISVVIEMGRQVQGGRAEPRCLARAGPVKARQLGLYPQAS